MRINWRKALLVTVDLAFAGYIVYVMASSSKFGRGDGTCGKVNINVADETVDGFIDAKEIKTRLMQSRLYPLGADMQSIDVRSIEEQLSSSPFVKTAECSKTIGGSVNISITQRLPIVRIKANNGDDYYLDDNDRVMPNSHYTSDLIIATGWISRPFAARYVSTLGKLLMESNFWRNQIEQINVTYGGGIELVPRVGDHIVYIGTLPQANDKVTRDARIRDYVTHQLDRLEKFYRYGLSKAGWNKYSYINLEFDNQIICKRKRQ